MTGAGSRAEPVLDLGSLALDRVGRSKRLEVGEPFTDESVTFLKEALDTMERAGGLPRFLFVTSRRSVRDAALLAIGFARAAAARGLDVLLLDASAGEPVLAKPFPYQPEEGLVDMVLWGASLQAALRKTKEEKIRVVNVGSPPPDPDALLGAKRFDPVLRGMRGEGEIVIAVGPLRGRGGSLSPLVRTADRTVVVSPAGAKGELPEAPRLSVIGIEEATAAPPGRGATRGEKKKVPLVRIALLFVLFSLLVGLLLSSLYLNRSEPAGERRVAVAGRPALEGTRAPAAAEERETVREETREAPAEEEILPSLPATAGAGARETGEAAAEEEEEETPPPGPPDRGPAAKGPFFGLHVESFPSRAEAERAAGRFRDGGEIVTIVRKDLPEKGTWYRIVLGRFATAAEAKADAADLKERFDLSYTMAVRVVP